MSPEKGHEGDQGLEHLSCQGGPRYLVLFSLKKRRLCGNLMAPSSTQRGPTGELKRDFIRGHVVTGQEEWLQNVKG